MTEATKALPYEIPTLPPHWHKGVCACIPGVAYIRVSKVGNRERIVSPQVQFDAIISYARANNIRLVAIVTDINKSGRSFLKRSVDKIIADIARGTYKRVILWKWSRWARNVEQSTKYLKLVRDAGGRVDSATEDSDQETALGRLQMDLLMRFDQYTSEVMGETWQAVHQQRRDAGLPHTGRARFGYDYTKNVLIRDGQRIETTEYVVNDGQAEVLAAGYADYVAGKSFRVMAPAWNALGFRTTQGGRWTPQAVARMMDTGFAAGLIRERSEVTDKAANRLSEYDVWREGSHRAIISPELWEAYKERRARQASIPPRARKAAHELSSLLLCGECGRRLQTKHAGAGRTHQWQCTWQKSFHPGVAVSANNRLLLEEVRAWIRANAGLGDEVDQLAQAHLANADRSDDGERERLEVELGQWKRRYARLVDLWTDERVDDATYEERKAEYEKEIKSIQDQLGEPEAPPVVRPDYEAFRTLDDEWEHFDAEGLNAVLAMLIGGVVVQPRTEASSRRSLSDRVSVVGAWETERLPRIKRSA